MKIEWRRWVVLGVIGFVGLGIKPALAAEVVKEEEESKYAKKGAVEAGGSITFDWGSGSFSAAIGPTLGYFLTDRVELSLLVNVNYDREDLGEEGRVITRGGDAVLEPSYHLPLTKTLLVFGGLGVGAGYENGTGTSFELAPRVGFNIEVGNSAVFSPTFKTPLLFGDDTSINYVLGLTVSAAF